MPVFRAQEIYTGLSTDSKPTPVSDGAVFLETDTNNVYHRRAGVWNFHGLLFVQALAPTADVVIGTLWSDTTANLLKRATSIAPIIFVSTEGGAGAHDLFSATHGDVDEADTPADGQLLQYNIGDSKWKAEPGRSQVSGVAGLDSVSRVEEEIKLLDAETAAPDGGSETEGQIYFDNTGGDKHAYIWVP